MLPTADGRRRRLLARLYSPPAARALLEPLLGIEAETAASLRAGLDHQVAHTRLQWWADECARCARGEARHPLSRQLVAACAQPAQQLAGLPGLVATNIWDLAQAPFHSETERRGYCQRWAAALIEPLLPASLASEARLLGSTLCELELLLGFVPDAQAGRWRLPLEELQQRGIQSVPPQSPLPDGLAELLARHHARARAALAEQLGWLRAPEQLALRGLLVWIGLAARASGAAQSSLPGVPRTTASTIVTDGWRAWTLARRASAGRFAL